MSDMMRWASAGMTILFAFWTGFQYNDPDALIWMVIYGIPAVASGMAFFGRLSAWAAGLVAGAAVLGGLYLAVRVISEGQFFFDETGRESMGFFVIAIWMGILWSHLRRRKPVAQATSRG